MLMEGVDMRIIDITMKVKSKGLFLKCFSKKLSFEILES